MKSLLSTIVVASMFLAGQAEAQWPVPGQDWRGAGRIVELPCAGGGCSSPYSNSNWHGRPAMPPASHYAPVSRYAPPPHPGYDYPAPSYYPEQAYAPPTNFRPMPIHNYGPAPWQQVSRYDAPPQYNPYEAAANLPPSLLQSITNGTQDLSAKHYVARNLVGEKKLFVKGQPVKNVLRFFSF